MNLHFAAHHRREPLSRGDADFEDEFEEEERALQSNGGARAWSLDDGPFKLVLIVNMQLKMGKGKASFGRCLLEQILTSRHVTLHSGGVVRRCNCHARKNNSCAKIERLI